MEVPCQLRGAAAVMVLETISTGVEDLLFFEAGEAEEEEEEEEEEEDNPNFRFLMALARNDIGVWCRRCLKCT